MDSDKPPNHSSLSTASAFRVNSIASFSALSILTVEPTLCAREMPIFLAILRPVVYGT
jgi:hypothetical protein